MGLQDAVRPRKSRAQAFVLVGLAGIALSAVLGAGVPRPSARVPAGLAAASEGVNVPAWPRFALFGWVSPPRESTTAGRYAELADAGLNLTVLAWADSGRVADNLARLDATRPRGVRNLLLDQQLSHVAASAPGSLVLADSIVRRYRDDPAFAGWYLGDEPPTSSFARLGELFAILRARDPAHPAWNNLQGRSAFPSHEAFVAYVRAYVAATQPAVLCDDEYEFDQSGDRGRLTENVATLAGIARENGLPFWGIVLLVQHASYRPVTTGMLRWQVAQWLAFGARGIGYFTYWTPAPDHVMNWQPAMIAWGTGARTAAYDSVRALNARLAPLGNTLAGMQWLLTEYAGSVPAGGTPFAPDSLLAAVDGRATLGVFADSTGAPHVFVASADSLAIRTVTLTLAEGRRAWRLRDDGGAWDALAVAPDGRLALTFAPGDFALLKLSGPADALAAGRAPHLALGPNPARGEVRFTFAGVAGRARLEVLDLGGRRVWSYAFAPSEVGVSWRGERDVGGRTSAGVYFARLEDARGVAVRRLSWLGAR